MDNGSFDRLARALSGSPSGSMTRRGVARLVGGLAIGGSLPALLGLAQAEAGKHKHKKHKKHKRHKKPVDTTALGGACVADRQCQGDLVCQIANSQNGTPERANQPVCCVPVDVHARCNDGTDCCGVSVICNGGYCQSS
jgi:hypothetical protein